ncbi:MAG: nitrilase family protein [Chitinophagaceae bacterium]|nr:nitrilase family protein [Chitinophagaceae bacterium]MCB0742170.1 nitrilase family protein [Chitinophagaceae bacterium]
MKNLRVTIIQTDIAWEDKTANLQLLQSKIDNIQEPTELVILPEMFNTGFSMQPAPLAETMDGETIQWMKKIAKAKKIILTGSLIIKEGDDYFNRLIWMLPTGEMGIYDKRHRFAFAGEDRQFAAGRKKLIASANGWKINVQVCYDLRFPVWARQMPADNYYDVLIYVASWPEKRIHAWKTLLQARAIENQCYVIGVNRVGKDGNDIYYNGESMIVDPLGEILYNQQDREDVFTTSLDKEHLAQIRNRFPFLKDADNFKIL